MTKKDFLKRIEEEKPETGGCGFFIDSSEIIPGGPAYYRCRKNNSLWKIYMPSERGGENDIFETTNEDEAFNRLYEIIKREERLNKRDNE